MVQPSPSYTVALYLEMSAPQKAVARLIDTVTVTGATVAGVDMADSDGDKLTVDLIADTRGPKHCNKLVAKLEEIDGVIVRNVGDSTFLTHVGGKIEAASKYPIRNRRGLARVYTPGVTRVCRTTYDHPECARVLTIKEDTVAVVIDGTAVLGLGDIGSSAAMPTMEGKTVLPKQFDSMGAWPVALDAKGPEGIISIVEAIVLTYGDINLEDIAAPKCFNIEAHPREELDIPVFHDDQHGAAIVIPATPINTLEIVGGKIEDMRIVLSGVDTVGSAIAKLLMAHGATDTVDYERTGTLPAANTEGMDEYCKWLAENTNPHRMTGSLKEGLKGAGASIGISSDSLLEPKDLEVMDDSAIVSAMINSIPEVDPVRAADYTAAVVTERSDFPNQINSVPAFPGPFHDLLNTGITDIPTKPLRAAPTGIASVIADDEISLVYITSSAFDNRVIDAVARAVRKFAETERET